MLLCEKETLLVWECMVRKAHRHKLAAVEELYSKGKLSKRSYKFACPLCDEYWDPGCDCPGCPWPTLPRRIPSTNADDVRCQRQESPYNDWRLTYSTLPYRQRRRNKLVYLYIKDFLTKKYEAK